MKFQNPARELTEALEGIAPGRALDLACGSGRHAIWLTERGWDVTGVDITVDPIAGVQCVQADLEHHEFRIERGSWDLIVCWLYWQPELTDRIARGVRHGGLVAMAGKTSGQFATSLAQYREAFQDWTEISVGENETRAFFIARKPVISGV